MEKKPIVSVIIPVNKAENYLNRCVESIRSQSYKRLDIILVDDGSSDQYPDICDHFAQSDPRIKVIHNENGGIASARNAGLNNIIGNYVTFVDGKDFVNKDYIKTLLFLCMKYDSELAACELYSGKETAFHNLTTKGRIYAYKKTTAFMSRKIKPDVVGKLFKTTLFVNVRFPAEEHINYEDEATTYKLVYKSNRIVYTDKKMYYNAQVPDSGTDEETGFMSLNFIDTMEDRINYFENREIGLLELSWEYYCKNLLDFYAKYKKDKKNPEDSEVILNLYKKAYKKVMENKITPVHRKLLFSAFYLAPDKCAFIINKLHLR